MTATTETRVLRMLDVHGTPSQRGRQQGEALRDVIAETIGRWSAAIERRHGVAAVDYFAELIATTTFVPTIEQYTPGLLDEVRGLADGANLPFETVFAYNLLDEEWEFSESRRAKKPGCTAACLTGIGVTPVVAQTMDIPTVHDGSQVAIRHKRDDGPDLAIFTGAGMIALNGANEHGIGVVVNNLSMLPHSFSGLPVMFMIRGALEQTSLADAARFVSDTPHAIGQHYLIGGPDGVVALEGAANGVARVETSGSRYVHANHPLANDAVQGDPAEIYANSDTFDRHNRAAQLIETASDQAGIEQTLMDEVVSIAPAVKSVYMTFGATSITCSAPPVVRVTAGPPHLAAWTDVPFV